ncbi:MAG: ATP-dependent helicase [Lachnospiraceae bacterium]|nr:ATP-dependent helicase [Lachnospiraceae bacterium]
MKKCPSSSQLSAITHIRGPALLIAGPGSGKTFTIVERLIYLTQTAKITPDSILTVTFSKAAANEMKNRYHRETGSYDVRFGTFHSTAFGILREFFRFDQSSLINEAQKSELLSQVFKDHGYASLLSGDYLKSILDGISREKNIRTDQEATVLRSDREDIPTEKLRAVITDYREYLRELHKIDCDDMILLCLEKLKKDEEVLSILRNRFRMILVDEFQDINEPQYELIKLLSFPENNLFAVGDDDQSIYGFRGSSPGIMQRFLKDFPDAKKLMLTENFRSGEKIVSFAGKVIAGNRERFEKSFRPLRNDGKVYFRLFESRKEEEGFLLKMISELGAELRSDTAVIVRTNREAYAYASYLKKHGIGISGTEKKKSSIFETCAAEDLCAYLRYLYEGKKREDFVRFMNRPERFLRQGALLHETVSFADLRLYYEKNGEMIKKIDTLEKQLLLAEKMSTQNAIRLFRNQLSYDRYVKENAKGYEEQKECMESLDRLTEIFSGYKCGMSVREFLNAERQKSETSYREAQKDDIQEGVRVMTMHASKGLEFGTVFLPDLNEGVIPPRNSSPSLLEEERRLLYVAMTRARNDLVLIATKERGRDVCRFIANYDKIVS